MKEVEPYEIDLDIRIKGDVYHTDKCWDVGYYLVAGTGEEIELPENVTKYFSEIADAHAEAILKEGL